MQIRIAGIVPESVVDGPGLRAVIFAQGCSHLCPGCHNPQTWDMQGGTSWEVEQLVAQIKKIKLITGVTFSGGEPFEQAPAFAQLAKDLRPLGFNILTYTGYTFEEILAQKQEPGWLELLQNTDLLIDGPFLQELKDLNLPFRGSKNQRIIDVAKSLQEQQVVLYQL
jgi:anaerobic ribonucleoside-triphosphate reductase activating protein